MKIIACIEDATVIKKILTHRECGISEHRRPHAHRRAAQESCSTRSLDHGCWVFIDSVEPTARGADGHPGIRQKIAVLSASAIKKAVPVRPARQPNSITRAPAAAHLAPA